MYQLTDSTSIIRTTDGACIPPDPANTDYQQFLKDQAEGAVVEPYAPPAFNQAAALDRLRKVREPLLNALAGLMADAIADADTALRDSLRTARQGLKDLPAHAPLRAATSDKDFDYIAHERYKALAAALPASARSAFKDALL